MKLKSYSQFPPGGFVYIQPQTGFKTTSGATFDETVRAVQRHRAANPRFNLATDRDSVANDVEAQICARLQRTAGASSYLDDESVAASPFRQAPLQAGQAPVAGGFRRVVVAAKNALAGVGAGLDWLGSGMNPVDQALASQRASVCSGCPRNAGGDLLQRLEGAAAEKLRQQIEIRKDMQLRTPFDANLKTCLACDCWTPLKVWVPFSHIEAHTRPQVWSQLHPECWMLSERTKAVTPIVVE